MARPYDIMVAGHLCLDIIPRFRNTGAKNISEIMRPGKLIKMNEVAISTGGPVSNTGLNMKTLGSKVCFCACVGDDKFGQITIEMLQESGNAEGIKLLKGRASSYTIVIAPSGIDRIFIHNPSTNDIFTSDNLDVSLIEKCRHFHFGYPPLMKGMYENEGDELMKVFKLAKQAGATTSCDRSGNEKKSP